MEVISEEGKEILKTFSELIPDLTEMEKQQLLYFGKGMAMRKKQEKTEKTDKQEALC